MLIDEMQTATYCLILSIFVTSKTER